MAVMKYIKFDTLVFMTILTRKYSKGLKIHYSRAYTEHTVDNIYKDDESYINNKVKQCYKNLLHFITYRIQTFIIIII